MKKQDPNKHVVLYEKNPAGATYGWGVVFSDRTLTSFREADLQTYEDITDHFVIWDAIDIRMKDEVIRCEGQVFSGIARKTLLRILQQRCMDLGVELHFETEIAHADLARDFDLVVAADGVHSIFREQSAKQLRPTTTEGASRYIWFGTDRSFDSFTFCFRDTEHGLFQAHAYPFDGVTGTFIVECRPEVWRNAGLDRSSEQESISFCQKVFEKDLRGASLMSNGSKWLTFPTLKCKHWSAGNIVFVGDAVHTAHFSIGSGTKLAMEDSIGLAEALRRNDEIDQALAEYEMDRRPRVEAFQEAARQSQTYFENTSRYIGMEPLQFAFNLLTRSGRVGYGEVRLKDPELVAGVDSFMSEGGAKLSPPPAFNRARIGGIELANRVVVSVPPTDEADNGIPDERLLSEVKLGLRSGAGLVLIDHVAPSADGRINSGSPGIYTDEQETAWSQALAIQGDGVVAANLSHAGARGSTLPRTAGVDIPLESGGWDLVAASAVPYASGGRVPREMDTTDMERVVSDLEDATRRVERAGFQAVGLDLSRGYLLGGFLSPLTNARDDEFGVSPEGRARFPLRVFDAVRTAWRGRCLFVTLGASDWARGGAKLADALGLARTLKQRGCDLIRVTAGQSVHTSKLHYDPYWSLHFTDVIRNEVGIATMPALSLPTIDDVNTVLGGGRADLASLRVTL